MTKKLILHLNESDDAKERAKTFGYKEEMLFQFTEGYLAKKCLVLQEINFIKNNFYELNSLFTPDLLVEVIGTVSQSLTKTQNRLEIQYNPNFIEDQHKPPFYLLMKDITAGFQKRCMLDMKIGKRCWNLGKPDDFIQDKKEKIAQCGIINLDLRSTGCEWFDENGKKQYVSRQWGFNAPHEEYQKMLRAFFRFKDTNMYYIEKLKKLYKIIEIVEEKYNMRFFSSSVLFAYDADDPTKCDMRIIDFEKCYIHIDEVIKQFERETMEDCEDGLLVGLSNLINLVSEISANL